MSKFIVAEAYRKKFFVRDALVIKLLLFLTSFYTIAFLGHFNIGYQSTKVLQINQSCETKEYFRTEIRRKCLC
uniref:Uncharacterized protein n=1 Tax=Plectus sambesii TaxID=2011161 RepID=A0A914VYC9_9BILA